MNPADFRDSEAEAGALGAVLVDGAAWDRVSVLVAEDFTSVRHAYVFRALQACATAREPFDHQTVLRQLQRLQPPQETGLELLMELDSTPAAYNPQGCVARVRDMALRRAAIKAANALMMQAAQLGRPAAESILEASSELAKLGAAGADAVLTGYEAMERYRQKQDAIQRGLYTPTIPTDIRVVDYLFGGLQRGCLTILGARPGIGKTALAVTIAINRARAFAEAAKEGRPCGRTGLLWLEDPVEALERRVVAQFSGVPIWQIAKEVLTGSALEAVGDGMVSAAEVTGDAWRIKEASGLSAAQAAACMRQMHAQHGVDLFIVDNLTEIELDERAVRNGGESGATRDAVRLIRNVAKDLDVPVLLLIHLSRHSSRDKDQQHQRPTLESGFGSSAIEKMARLMIFLWEDPMKPGYLAGFVPKQNEGAKYLDFWVRMHESAALVLNRGGGVPEGTKGYTDGADADGVDFIRVPQEAA